MSGSRAKPVLLKAIFSLAIFVTIDCRLTLAQALNSSQANQIIPKFNVYCDPNGGNTGTCWTFDQNAPLDCQYASQDFIQCSLRATKQKLICLAYAPYQFACRQEVDSGESTLGKQTIRSGIGEPLPQNLSPQQPVNQNQFKSDFVDVFSN